MMRGDTRSNAKKNAVDPIRSVRCGGSSGRSPDIGDREDVEMSS